ncbi:hypothetical protein SCITRI_001724 [Spiroplasma citri]|nr:hypothetical protein SCITRI_001724 [Spiroplasma citri]
MYDIDTSSHLIFLFISNTHFNSWSIVSFKLLFKDNLLFSISNSFDNNNSKLLSSFWCNGALTVIELPLCAFLTIYFPSSLSI